MLSVGDGAEAITGIKPLLVAIRRLLPHSEEPYSNQICGSLHKEFTKLCLKAKCYQHALQVVERPSVSFKKSTQPLDIVSYFYYKALIFMGLKRYVEAMEQFRMVLAYPANCTHKVHCESYKKLMLLTLLQVAEGQTPLSNAGSHLSNLVPKSANQILKFKLEQSFPIYHALAEAFQNRDKPLVFEELVLVR